MTKKEKRFDHTKISEMIEEYKKNLPAPVSRRLASILHDMIITASTSNRFRGYSPDWRDDMISRATLCVFKYIKNYNPNKSTDVYNYVYKICHQAFVYELNKKKLLKENIEYEEFMQDPLDQTDCNIIETETEKRNRDIDVANDDVNEILIYYLRNNPGLEDRFLVNFLVDSMKDTQYEVRKKYSITKYQYEEYKKEIIMRLQKFTKNAF